MREKYDYQQLTVETNSINKVINTAISERVNRKSSLFSKVICNYLT